MTAFVGHKLQEAVFSLLSADTTLGLKLTGIYDQPPQNTRPPYISMGDTSVQPAEMKDRAGNRISFDIMIWSGEPSQMEAKELMADVNAVLHQSKPPIDGFDLVDMRLVSANVVRQFTEAGGLYRGRMNYSALVFAVG